MRADEKLIESCEKISGLNLNIQYARCRAHVMGESFRLRESTASTKNAQRQSQQHASGAA